MPLHGHLRRQGGPTAPAGAAGTNAGSPLPRVLAGVAVAALLAACSSAPASQPEPPPEDGSRAGAPAAEPGEPGEPEPPVDERSEQEQVDELWTSFYRAWVEQVGLEEPEPAAFADLVVDPGETISNLVAQRLDGRPLITAYEQWPHMVIDGDTATISDCVITTQHEPDEDGSSVTLSTSWEATATATDDGWRIATARPRDLFCVAEELNEQLLDAYRDYRAAKEAAWDPPDPDHPALERTMTGEHLEFIHRLLEEHQRDRIVVRDPAPTDNAVVWELGIGAATVSDCVRQVEGRGAFDADSGERLDDLIAPVREGQLDAQSVDLVRTDEGVWKVENQAGTRDTDCIEGSTRYEVR
jgi:hypothetical protein